MSNPLKKIGKALKSVVKGVGKIFKKIGKGVKKLFSSGLGKAVLIGAGLFFAVPAAAGALGLGASGASGAGAWWSSKFGAAGSAGTAAGTAGTAAAGTAGTAAAGGAASGGFALPAMTQAGSHAGLAANAAGINAGGGLLGAAAQGASLAGSAAKGLGGLAKGAVGAFGKLSPTAQAAAINMAGQGIAGHYEQKAAEEEQERMWKRENEVYNRGGSWGIGNDGRKVEMPSTGYQPQINSPTGLLAQTNQRSTGFTEEEEAERLWEEMSPAERMQTQRQLSAHRFG